MPVQTMYLGVAKPVVLRFDDGIEIAILEHPLAKHVMVRRRRWTDRAALRAVQIVSKLRAAWCDRDLSEKVITGAYVFDAALKAAVIATVFFLGIQVGIAFWSGRVAQILATPTDCTTITDQDLQAHCWAESTKGKK